MRLSSLRCYLAAGRVSLSQRFRYPLELAGPLLTFALFIFIFGLLWNRVFEGKAAIEGYSREACTWYFMFAELVIFSASGSFWAMSRDVKDGQVAYSLGRPFNFVNYLGAQRLATALGQTPFFFAVGYLVASLMAGFWVPASALQLLGLGLSVLLSYALQYSLHASVGMTAFWFEENSAFMWIFSKLVLVIGTLTPLEFLPQSWQSVLLWTPFPWIVWAPARLAVLPDPGPGELALLLGGQLAWLVLAFALAQLVFSRAVRRTTVQGG